MNMYTYIYIFKGTINGIHTQYILRKLVSNPTNLYKKSKNNQELPMTSLNFKQLKIKRTCWKKQLHEGCSVNIFRKTYSTNILENPQSWHFKVVMMTMTMMIMMMIIIMINVMIWIMMMINPWEYNDKLSH